MHPTLPRVAPSPPAVFTTLGTVFRTLNAPFTAPGTEFTRTSAVFATPDAAFTAEVAVRGDGAMLGSDCEILGSVGGATSTMRWAALTVE